MTAKNKEDNIKSCGKNPQLLLFYIRQQRLKRTFCSYVVLHPFCLTVLTAKWYHLFDVQKGYNQLKYQVLLTYSQEYQWTWLLNLSLSHRYSERSHQSFRQAFPVKCQDFFVAILFSFLFQLNSYIYRPYILNSTHSI